MLQGLGNDIVEVSRIKRAVERHGDKFLNRIYSEDVLGYCCSKRNRYQCLAGRFAAKEAVIKAIGEKKPWKKIEIVPADSGKPVVRLAEPAKNPELSKEYSAQVSISHTERFATAIAIITG